MPLLGEEKISTTSKRKTKPEGGLILRENTFHGTHRDGARQGPATSLQIKFYWIMATVTYIAQLLPPQAQLGSYGNQAWTFTVQSFTEPMRTNPSRQMSPPTFIKEKEDTGRFVKIAPHIFHLCVTPETNWYLWKFSASLRTSEMQYCPLKATLSSYRPCES